MLLLVFDCEVGLCRRRLQLARDYSLLEGDSPHLFKVCNCTDIYVRLFYQIYSFACSVSNPTDAFTSRSALQTRSPSSHIPSSQISNVPSGLSLLISR